MTDKKPKKSECPRRLVRVFVTDPDHDVPVADCVLYSSPEMLTDATDGELFLAIDVPGLLEAHNEKRTTLDLEPIRARDLRLGVATLTYI